jgi:torulene dioxygenase
VSHWFDGFAQAHKFDIIAPASPSEETTVLYSSRRQSEDFIEHIKRNGGWRSSTTFAQEADPCIGIFAKAMSIFEPERLVNNVAVLRNVPGLGRHGPQKAGQRTGTANLYVSTDAFTLQELEPDTLEPLGYTDQARLHPELKGLLSCAHAERDRETGDLFNFNLEFGLTATYRVFRTNANTGATDILATISEPGVNPAYIHSFFLTANYVVIAIPSSHFAWAGLKILWKRNLLQAMKPFDKSNPMRWLVVDRRHGKGLVSRFSTPAGFFFHSVNAFEQLTYDEHGRPRTDLNLDYLAYDNTDIMRCFYYDIMLDLDGAAEKHWSHHQWSKSFNPRLVRQRFRIPLPASDSEAASETHETAEEVFSIPGPHVGELPTINPQRVGEPYRYVYCAGNRGLSTITDSIVKTDLQTREAIYWCGPVGHSPGEPIFVPRPDAFDEDDGVILSMVLDGSAEISYLLCLDARTMEEIGKAEAEFAIPLGFHGIHAPVVD